MKRSIPVYLVAALLVLLPLAACNSASPEAITASGTLSFTEIAIAPEVSGRVTAVHVSEGETVKAGDELFRIDDEVLKAQHDQAKAAADAASATLAAAQAQLQYAQSQRDLAVQGAQIQDAQIRQQTWDSNTKTNFQQPWYFQKSELITSAQAEVDAALRSLNEATANLEQELKKVSNQDFIAAEKRLARAQMAYVVADTTLDQAKKSGKNDLVKSAQENFDLADSELKNARLDYDRMLNTSTSDDILKARARVAVARGRYENARDALSALQTGDDSNQVRVAEAGVEQARAAVTQAEANLNQANASLVLAKLQLDRAAVKAPIDGVILSRKLEQGELVAAGSNVMSMARTEDMSLIVYLPEDLYGHVAIGQDVNIVVDSFPGRIFKGSVTHISDKAEFTPRNVQTADSRSSTVYAIKITAPNTDGALKAGMPADVTFIP